MDSSKSGDGERGTNFQELQGLLFSSQFCWGESFLRSSETHGSIYSRPFMHQLHKFKEHCRTDEIFMTEHCPKILSILIKMLNCMHKDANLDRTLLELLTLFASAPTGGQILMTQHRSSMDRWTRCHYHQFREAGRHVLEVATASSVFATKVSPIEIANLPIFEGESCFIKLINISGGVVHVTIGDHNTGEELYPMGVSDPETSTLLAAGYLHYRAIITHVYSIFVNRRLVRTGEVGFNPQHFLSSDGHHAILTWNGDEIGSYHGAQKGRYLNHGERCDCVPCRNPRLLDVSPFPLSTDSSLILK